MYSGTPTDVRLLCRGDMMNAVVDRFGEGVKTRLVPRAPKTAKPDRPQDRSFTADVTVGDAPTFYAWVFQFGGAIRILEPENMVQRYQEIAEELRNRSDDEKHIKKIDAAEAPSILTQYLSEVVRKGLDRIAGEDISAQLSLVNKVVNLISRETAEEDLSTNETEIVATADDISSDEITTDNTVQTSEETITEAASAAIAEETTKIVEETETASSDYPELYVSDLTVSAITDYAHAFDEVYLGEGEGVTIRILMPEGTTSDEILVLGDDEMLNISQQSEEDARLTFYITGKKVGVTELYMTTCYEVDTKGEEATCRTVRIHKLNSSEGRLLYITPNGEKYHNSASCAGENAMKTTYLDCAALEYDPCGKCAR